MKYNVFNYKSMRAKKYYDVVKTNKSFIKSPLKQKIKITNNVLKYFMTIKNKPQIIKNKPVTAK